MASRCHEAIFSQKCMKACMAGNQFVPVIYVEKPVWLQARRPTGAFYRLNDNDMIFCNYIMADNPFLTK
jgi:hypothetical protein